MKTIYSALLINRSPIVFTLSHTAYRTLPFNGQCALARLASEVGGKIYWQHPGKGSA